MSIDNVVKTRRDHKSVSKKLATVVNINVALCKRFDLFVMY